MAQNSTYAVKQFTLNSVSVTGKLGVTWNENQIPFGPGITADTDVYETFLELIGRDYTFSLVGLTFGQANAIKDASGTDLTIVFPGSGTGNDFKITSSATAKQIGGITMSQQHRAPANWVAQFRLIGASGSSDPATYSTGTF